MIVILCKSNYNVPMQSVPISNKNLSLNPAHDEVYLIQKCVIKFVSDLWQVGGFLRYSGFLHHLTCSP